MMDKVDGHLVDCPFDTILARTPYFVMPKMAIQAMPRDWRLRLAALLDEAEECGMETPEYHVFRDVTYGNPDGIKGCKNVGGWRSPFYRLTGGFQEDPWANYRHGQIKDLCPKFEVAQ